MKGLGHEKAGVSSGNPSCPRKCLKSPPEESVADVKIQAPPTRFFISAKAPATLKGVFVNRVPEA